MLNSFEKNIISLVKSSLDGTAPHISGILDLESIYKFSQKMQITPLIYYAIEKAPGAFDDVYGKKFLKSSVNYTYICQNQIARENEIFKCFDEEKIDYLVLKGAQLRDYYPHPEMRLMSDADILVKIEQYRKIKRVMKSLGYTQIVESDHEYVWRRDNTNIELHKRLIPSYNKDYYSYFGDGWRLAKHKADEGNRYELSNEDNFIYLFVHYAKHYRDAGIGIKHIADFYVFLNTHKTLDWEYIEIELEKLQLLEFWKNTKKLLGVWFDGAECDEKTAFMTHRAFAGSAYGTSEAHMLSKGVKMSKSTKNVKGKSILNSIFPSYRDMKQSHKYLRYLPFLLPLAWVFRWIAVLFSPKRVKHKKQELEKLTSHNLEKYQNELNYVGLEFNFS